MVVLGLDTALGACSAAWWRDGHVLARRFEPMARGHAERLFPLLEALNEEAGLSLAQADRIAVTVGPGSFTGTRVGLAAARGIALAAGCPAVGITTLGAVAANSQEVAAGAALAVLFDAGRGGFYGQVFGREQTRLTAPFAASADAVAGIVSGAAGDRPVQVIGTGADKALTLLAAAGGSPVTPARGNPLPDAAVVARLGAALEPGDKPPAPLYLRPPDAVRAAPLIPLA